MIYSSLIYLERQINHEEKEKEYFFLNPRQNKRMIINHFADFQRITSRCSKHSLMMFLKFSFLNIIKAAFTRF